MKILHLVTLASSDATAGGPLRVAMNQAGEMGRRGHEVHIAAGWKGGSPPVRLAGTQAYLFRAINLLPKLGLSAMVSPGLAVWLIWNVHKYDVVHVHAGRDAISITSLLITTLSRKKFFAQTHGMIQPDNRLLSRLVDALAVRPLLPRAAARFVLTRREQEGLVEVIGTPIRFERLLNGVPLAYQSPVATPNREVLYCARLHDRKRPMAFVGMAETLLRRGVAATFALVGPDGGELPAVLAAIANGQLEGKVSYEGALDYASVLDRMRRSGIYVLSAVDEPFGLTLVEAMSVGLPCVCTDTCDLADILQERGAALVTDGSVEGLADAVERILGDDRLWLELSRNGFQAVEELFSIKAIGGQLEHFYRNAFRPEVQAATNHL